jgi:hypothetical protein
MLRPCTQYNHALITKTVKLMEWTELLTSHQRFYDQLKFKYFSLTSDYYSITIRLTAEFINFSLDIISDIEDKFSDDYDELQKLKIQVVTYCLKNQVNPKMKDDLIKYLGQFCQIST